MSCQICSPLEEKKHNLLSSVIRKEKKKPRKISCSGLEMFEASTASTYWNNVVFTLAVWKLLRLYLHQNVRPFLQVKGLVMDIEFDFFGSYNVKADESRDRWFSEAPCCSSTLKRTWKRKQQESQHTFGVTSCFYDEKEFMYKTDSL